MSSTITPHRQIRTAVLLVALCLAEAGLAQTAAFTYQGKLTESGNPANGNYDMQFKLFDALSGGSQQGSTITNPSVQVAGGIFAVNLDFGANVFSGATRYLEIAVRQAGNPNPHTILAPREQIASSPYAVRTLSAASADNALSLGGIAASEYVTTTNGGNSFIRNGTTLQTGNFNISGNGQFGGNVVIANSSVGGWKLYVHSSGNAIWGDSTGGGWGIYGSSSGGGVGSYAGAFDGRVYVRDSVGIGTGSPLRELHVNGRARIGSIPLEVSAASVCFNAAGDLLQCGASSLKWKTDVRPFNLGLETILRLRPINFNWKESGLADFGLGAEDVAQIAPELTFINANGEVEGVKYDRLSVVFVNAFKEQQAQIEKQQAQIERQQREIAELRQAVLVLRPKASARSHRRR